MYFVLCGCGCNLLCVCVCQPLGQGFTFTTTSTTVSHAGGRGISSCGLCQRSSTLDDQENVPAQWHYSTFPCCVLVPWLLLTILSPQTGFPPQTCSRLATTLTVRVQTLFNHTVLADFFTMPFHHLPSQRGNWVYLNTIVRVCFAQPSHSGAECDPRHWGAVSLGKHSLNLPPLTGTSLELTYTPTESTATMAAGALPRDLTVSQTLHRFCARSCICTQAIWPDFSAV